MTSTTPRSRPSIALVLECRSPHEFERRFARLTEGGEVVMPPDDHRFSSPFAWPADHLGVSWQLDVA